MVPQARDQISIAYIQKQLPTIGDKPDHGKVQERDNGGSQQYWWRSKKHSWFFFFVFLSDNGEELRVMIMKPGMVWHKDQITFKIEYNVN
jgi:hypothetical protein